jgi:broad specificity phosphatase PhoE
MSSVIFIRHGESLGNVDPFYYEQHDAANILSQKGVDQCLNLQKEIGKIMDSDFYLHHTTVIASRYQRAQITAQIVMGNHRLEIQTDPRLNEVYHTAHNVATETRDHVINRVRALVE